MLTASYLRNLTIAELKQEFRKFKERWEIAEEKQSKLTTRLKYAISRAPRKNRRSKGNKFRKENDAIKKEMEQLDLERLLFEDEFILRTWKWSNFWLNNTKGKRLGNKNKNKRYNKNDH